MEERRGGPLESRAMDRLRTVHDVDPLARVGGHPLALPRCELPDETHHGSVLDRPWSFGNVLALAAHHPTRSGRQYVRGVLLMPQHGLARNVQVADALVHFDHRNVVFEDRVGVTGRFAVREHDAAGIGRDEPPAPRNLLDLDQQHVALTNLSRHTLRLATILTISRSRLKRITPRRHYL